jgi:allophanate hydrolase subunit 1
VYPLETPGGWHLVGSTATVMFDLNRNPAALLRVGDRVRFVAQ